MTIDNGGSQFRRSKQMNAKKCWVSLPNTRLTMETTDEEKELMIDVLSRREQRLRKTIEDALGRERCICGVGIGHPLVPAHSPQCQELRKAVQYE